MTTAKRVKDAKIQKKFDQAHADKETEAEVFHAQTQPLQDLRTPARLHP